MKILVSAYACNPYAGSEPGVGWDGVIRIARKHDVWVITDSHNRMGWERGYKENIIPANVQVRFLRRYKPCSENRFFAHLQSWAGLSSFNRQILPAAREWHREIGFDICHQVTVAAWRMPSSLWQLGVPFVWGPIGGAGYIPSEFRGMLSVSARAFETFRDWNTAYTLRSQAFCECIRESSMVFVANEETEELMKPHRAGRPMQRLPIVSISREKGESFRRKSFETQGTQRAELKLFAGGNIEGRKGVSLALQALSRVKAAGCAFQYTIAGGGPEIPALRALSKELGLDNEVVFHPGYRGSEYISALHASDIYFLPSFRESTPVTLLEAYLAGCYPIVADTSAQGEIVRMAGGTAVSVDSVQYLVEGLAQAVLEFARNRPEKMLAQEAARQNVLQYFDAKRYDTLLDAAYTF